MKKRELLFYIKRNQFKESGRNLRSVSGSYDRYYYGKKRRSKVFLAIIVIFLVAIFLLLLRVRGSVSVKPEKDFQIPENIVYAFQKNPLWGEDRLGASAYTMESSGCLTTCLTSVVSMQDIVTGQTDGALTPGTLNALFSSHNVYDGEGNVQWGQLESLLGVSIVRKQASGLSSGEIDSLLGQGCFPIVRVRVAGLGNYHFVLIVGAQDGEYLCMDPLNEKEKAVPLSKFWNRVYAIRYVI